MVALRTAGIGSPSSLQWGRGGWPADGTQLISSNAASSVLQWGRGGWPADGQGDHRRMSADTYASMGPRGLARGWLTKRPEAMLEYSLQWGRGGWPADGCAGVRAAGQGRGFNGAAGVGPRMEQRWQRSLFRLYQLQWGRGGWPADGVQRVTPAPATWDASMGPRGLARGWGME